MELAPFFESCPLCGGTRSAEESTQERWRFVRCEGCGLVFKDRAVVGSAEEDSAYYHAEYAEGRKAGRQQRYGHRVAKARRQIRAGLRYVRARRVLDVGCSYGYAVQAGLDLGLESSGVDISAHVVEACRERGYDAHVGTLEQMPFEDGRFDLIVMKHVLEHARSPAQALAEARRLLAPGGVLVVAVPDVEYWKYSVYEARAKGYRGKLGWEHHVYYSARTLERMLEQHGFQVRARSKAVVLPASSALGRMWESLRWAGISLWQGLARLTRTRRELFFVASRE